MTRALAPRESVLPPGAGGPALVLGGVWVAAGLLWVTWAAGTLATRVAAPGAPTPAFGVSSLRGLVHGGPGAVWPGTPPAALWTALATAGLLAAVLGTASAVLAAHLLSRGDAELSGQERRALTRLEDAGALTGAVARGRALVLRPSLTDPEDSPRAERDLDGADIGVALGVLADGRRPRRREQRGAGRRSARAASSAVVRASWEDVVLAVMAPRAGKTTALAIPTVLDAPGAVVATSNKADLWAATASHRQASTGEAVWVFDPQRITATPQWWWWNPLATASTVEGAHRLAGHFVTEVRNENTGRDFWTAAATDLLTSLLLAAATSGGSLLDVYEWLGDPALPTPANLLREAGHDRIATALTARQHGASETRDGVYETARTAAACLRDPAITAWVTPPGASEARSGTGSAIGGGAGRGRGLVEFDAAAFPTTGQTLYLLSKDGAGAAAPLVAALTDAVMRAGVTVAERTGMTTTGVGGGGGVAARLDPPMVVVLDEAANVCKIADLPDLYSHLGSRGIIPITVLQSYRQGTRVWGAAGMDTLWSAATIKLLGAGLDDAKLVEDVSRLVGDHDVAVRSHTDSAGRAGSRSTSTSLRRQRILAPDALRALPRGTALLLATGTRPVLLRLLPAYERADHAPLAAAPAASSASQAEREVRA